jgi:hypothetical protein
MRNKKVLDNTTNRGEFNRAYKMHLEQKGKIHCSRCGYHRGENCRKKYYGGYHRYGGHLKMTYPNWKLVSKNYKQWMEKPIKIITKFRINHNREYTEIIF